MPQAQSPRKMLFDAPACAYGHELAVPRKKISGRNRSLGSGCLRFRFRLGRPRAEAHMWGKGARILTEINRLTQLNLLLNAKLCVRILSAGTVAASLLGSRPGQPTVSPDRSDYLDGLTS